MTVHVVNPHCRALQAHDLLMLLHQAKRHPDGTRQRGRRQTAKDRRAARELKSRPVPLCFVDPTVWLRYKDWEGRERWRRVPPEQPFDYLGLAKYHATRKGPAVVRGTLTHQALEGYYAKRSA